MRLAVARRGGTLRDRIAFTALLLIAVVTIAPPACSISSRDRFASYFLDLPTTATTTDAVNAPRSGSESATDSRHLPPSADAPSKDPAWKRFAAVPVSIHPPYLERQCAACHDPAASMRVSESFMNDCRDCHDRYFGEEVGHIPVQRGQCFACHEPHLAWHPHLLSRSAYRTCMMCHKKPENLSPDMHSRDDVTDCTRCHDPHFGHGFLLKDSAPLAPGKR